MYTYKRIISKLRDGWVADRPEFLVYLRQDIETLQYNITELYNLCMDKWYKAIQNLPEGDSDREAYYYHMTLNLVDCYSLVVSMTPAGHMFELPEAKGGKITISEYETSEQVYRKLYTFLMNK